MLTWLANLRKKTEPFIEKRRQIDGPTQQEFEIKVPRIKLSYWNYDDETRS